MMQPRGTASWIAVGTLAVVGGFWLTTRSLQILRVEGAWLPYAGHFVGALIAGAMMVAHAALRPWREPVAAAVVAVGVLAVMFLALPRPWFSWVAARSSYPWLMALVLAGVCASGALCGALIARRVASTKPRTAKLMLLSALTITGCMVITMHLVLDPGFADRPRAGTVIPMLLSVMAGGFLTQLVVPVYRPWASGGGAIVLVLLLYAEAGLTREGFSALTGALSLAAVGALGARFARRWVPPAVEGANEPLPSARLH